MCDNVVHRVYIREEGSKPEVVGVVTPTDILALVAGLGGEAGAEPTGEEPASKRAGSSGGDAAEQQAGSKKAKIDGTADEAQQ